MEDSTALGCIIFDEPRCPRRGWMAIGEEGAERFDETTPLEDTAFFLTNLPVPGPGQMNSIRDSRLRASAYLREDISSLARRFHLDDQRCLAEFGAKIFSRLLRLTRRLCPALRTLPGYSLARDLSVLTGPGDTLLSPELAHVLASALVRNTFCQRTYPFKSEDVGIFTLPQTRFLGELFNLPLPFGRFLDCPTDLLPRPQAGQDAVLDFIATNRGRAGLFVISLSSLEEPLNSLLNPELRNKESSFPFITVTSPELELYAGHSKLTVHKAWFATSSYRLDPNTFPMNVLASLSDFSLSASIWCDVLWHSFCVRHHARAQSRTGLVYVNALAPFLYARGRVLLSAKAMALRELGCDVLGFANGRIRVNLKDMDNDTVWQLAMSTDLMPPLPWGGSQKYSMAHQVKDLPELLAYDLRWLERVLRGEQMDMICGQVACS